MIIDIHTHVFPDNVANKAIPALAQKAAMKPWGNGTLANLKKSMVNEGIDRSVILPIATKPEQTPTINRWAAEVNNDKIISFGTIHPDYKHWQDEINWIINQGIKGIKFHPDYQNFFVDEKRLYPIYEKLFDAGLIVLFHAGIDVGYPEPCHCKPKTLKKILDHFPGATIIAAHMGGYKSSDEVSEFLLGENIYLDTSFSFHQLGAESMTKMILDHGPEKILFGTDSPWTDPLQEITNLRSLNLGEQELRAVLGGNAKGLLNLS